MDALRQISDHHRRSEAVGEYRRQYQGFQARWEGYQQFSCELVPELSTTISALSGEVRLLLDADLISP